MARAVRAEVTEETQVGVYHCVNRCVRRTFLCCDDPVSGRNFEHRKQQIQRRLEMLAGQFGIDVLGFTIMSNHLHIVVRNRPDVVAGWSNEDVADGLPVTPATQPSGEGKKRWGRLLLTGVGRYRVGA